MDGVPEEGGGAGDGNEGRDAGAWKEGLGYVSAIEAIFISVDRWGALQTSVSELGVFLHLWEVLLLFTREELSCYTDWSTW